MIKKFFRLSAPLFDNFIKITVPLTAALLTAAILVFVLSSAFTRAASAGHSYKVSGLIRGLTGEHKVYISIYSNEANFEDGHASKSLIVYPAKIKEGKAEYFFLMPEGNYLIMAFEDKNGDGKLNYGGFFNSPREPYGFYKRFRPLLSAPSFDRLKFNLNKEVINANINLIKM
jgi:uncharacterized protein (DUF2141 family)